MDDLGHAVGHVDLSRKLGRRDAEFRQLAGRMVPGWCDVAMSAAKKRLESLMIGVKRKTLP
jgi:hypothetical protein